MGGDWKRVSCQIGQDSSIYILEIIQPRPQALSPLPPFVDGRKTLVAPGHVTPRIWVVKKSVGREGWQSTLIVAVANFVGFKTSSSR